MRADFAHVSISMMTAATNPSSVFKLDHTKVDTSMQVFFIIFFYSERNLTKSAYLSSVFLHKEFLQLGKYKFRLVRLPNSCFSCNEIDIQTAPFKTHFAIL